jgi:prevent-host-death family protein
MRSTDVQRSFRSVVNRAASGEEHIIVERDGLPVIVILSVAEYELLMHEHEANQVRQKQLERIARSIGQQMAEAGLSESDVIEGMEATRAALYAERYDKPN